MWKSVRLGLCAALSLAWAATAFAEDVFTRRGMVPEVGSGEAARPADAIDAGSGLTAGALMAPKAQAPAAIESLVGGLAGIRHGRDGKDAVIEVPPRLRTMLRARGVVKPVTPGKTDKGKLTQVKNTKVYPYAAIGVVMSGCTGALVMKRFVLTAPWCVYDTQARKFYDNLDFVPALNGEDAPVGTVKWKNVWIPQGFAEKGDLGFAFALIELDAEIGDQTGWFGFGPAKDSDAAKQLTLAGYPFEGVAKNTVWEASCKIDASEENAWFYRCPGKGNTLYSMLGAPFFAKGKTEADGAQLLGIHISSQNDNKDSWWAIKLTQAHTETILGWANGGDAPPEEVGEEETEEGTGETAECTCEEQASGEE
jgi:V8-like Glu-specific endopeptidase